MYRELFQRRGLSLDRLQALVRVADAASLISAAGNNPVLQSQFSRQLRDLENFFECSLTKRNGKNLVMSSAGHRLAQLSRLYLSGLHDFMQEQKKEPRVIRVGAGERLSRWLLAPLLGAMPDADRVTFAFENLRSTDIIAKLHSHELDFGLVRSAKPIPRPLKATRLGVMRYAYFATDANMPSPGTRNRSGRGHPRIADIHDARRQQIHGDVFRTLFGRNVTPAFVCSSLPAVAHLVQSGLAGGVLPVMAEREFDHKHVQITALPPDASVHELLWMAWNPRLVELVPANEKYINAFSSLAANQLERAG